MVSLLMDICFSCGKKKWVEYRTLDKRSVCSECFEEKFKSGRCAWCRQERRVAALTKKDHLPICALCYTGTNPMLCKECKRAPMIQEIGICASCFVKRENIQPQKSQERKRRVLKGAEKKSVPLSGHKASIQDIRLRVERQLEVLGHPFSSLSSSLDISRAIEEGYSWVMRHAQSQERERQAECYVIAMIVVRISFWLGSQEQDLAFRLQGEEMSKAKEIGFEEDDILQISRRIASLIPKPRIRA